MQKTLLILITLIFGVILTHSQPKFEWPIKQLDTARDIKYLSESEKDVVLEINKVRYNPKQYAIMCMQFLEPFYNGKFLDIPGKTRLMTQEGKDAFIECIEALKNAAPAPILKPSKAMSLACQLHTYDQGITGNTGHTGSGKSSALDRLKRFGQFYGSMGENLHYGDTEPRFIVISLLIDDGVKSRGHRKTILNNEFNLMGISIGNHKVYGGMCAMNYATRFEEK